MKASEIVDDLNEVIKKCGDLEVMCEEYKIIKVSEIPEDWEGNKFIILEGYC
jgi:hypothetical protein